jgi:hypothetical protein
MKSQPSLLFDCGSIKTGHWFSQELLMTLLAMDKSADEGVRSTARVIKSNIFYVLEYREMSQVLLQSFDPAKLPM